MLPLLRLCLLRDVQHQYLQVSSTLWLSDEFSDRREYCSKRLCLLNVEFIPVVPIFEHLETSSLRIRLSLYSTSALFADYGNLTNLRSLLLNVNKANVLGHE